MEEELAVNAAPDLKEWFVEQYQRHANRLYLIAYGVLRDAQGAQDATQEAALRVYRKLDVLADPNALRGYLATTTRNVAVDMLRKRQRVRPQEELEVAAPEGDRPGRDELAQLEAAFQRLPLDYQEVVFLRYREALNAREIAERLGISHDNARARLSRAHKQLRRELGVEIGV